MAVVTMLLAGCGGGGSSSHSASPPPATSAPAAGASSPSPSLDNFAEIACTEIDKARAAEQAFSASEDPFGDSPNAGMTQLVDAIKDYEQAIIAGGKSSLDGIQQQIALSGNLDTVTNDPHTFETTLANWRSFCENHGWVGTP